VSDWAPQSSSSRHQWEADARQTPSYGFTRSLVSSSTFFPNIFSQNLRWDPTRNTWMMAWILIFGLIRCYFSIIDASLKVSYFISPNEEWDTANLLSLTHCTYSWFLHPHSPITYSLTRSVGVYQVMVNFLLRGRLELRIILTWYINPFESTIDSKN